MAKKAKKIGISKVPPKSEAVPLGSKPVKGARKATASEVDRVERGRKLAASYLVQRDGMDEQLAEDIITSMTPEDINALITEANTAVMDRVNAAQGNGDMAGAPAAVEVKAEAEVQAEAEVEADEGDGEIPEFTDIPALMAEEEFPEWVVSAAEWARARSNADKQYKATKKKLVSLLKRSKVEAVMCLGHRLKMYTGHSPAYLDEHKLLEAGVPADVIAKCWSEGKPYDDVRITSPR